VCDKAGLRADTGHMDRMIFINNSLGEEYRDWWGWPEHNQPGRSIALGEYIVELCDLPGHDKWYDDAKDAYLEWKKVHGHTTTPPPTPSKP
jgi:hypothetical protein